MNHLLPDKMPQTEESTHHMPYHPFGLILQRSLSGGGLRVQHSLGEKPI